MALTPHPGLSDDSGTPIRLGRGLVVSGEARLFERDGHPGHVIKLHHAPDRALQRKLDTLPGLAPEDPSLLPDHVSYAWPLSAVRNLNGDAVGCLIPHVHDALTLTSIANPKLRKRRAPWVTFATLHAIAASIAFAVDRLHAAGVVLGDIRPENVLVARTGLPTLIDCDSYQVRDQMGRLHPCRVGSEGFTAPEWIGRSFGSGARAESADRFGLAVLLHQLLTGTHPWTGTWQGTGDPPGRDRLIRDGEWPFRPGAKLHPVPGMVGPDDLAPELAALFRQAFIAGSTDPEARPSARDWYAAASAALAELEVCAANPAHSYDVRLDACPWCAREAAGLPDPHTATAAATDPWQPAILALRRALARGDLPHAQELWQAMPSLAAVDALAPLQALLGPAQASEQAAQPLIGDEVSSAAPVQRSSRLDIPPIPESARTIALSYQIDAGWGGLRAPRLEIRVTRAEDIGRRLPPLELVRTPDGRRVTYLPAGRAQRVISLPFERQEHAGILSLQGIDDGSGCPLAIAHPPETARTLSGFVSPTDRTRKDAIPSESYFALANTGASLDN